MTRTLARRPALAALAATGAIASLWACAIAVAACSDSTHGPPSATDGGGAEGAIIAPEGGTDAAGDGPDDGAAGADVDASAVQKKIVLVSTATSDGKMTFGGRFALGGRHGADELCNAEAARSALAGTFVAWLSTFGEAAVDRLPSGAAWYLGTSPILVFASKAAIPAGPLVPIDADATNVYPPASAGVWTGTEQSATRSPNTCVDWTFDTNAAAGRRGRVDALGLWTSERDDTCERQLHVYCFEK